MLAHPTPAFLPAPLSVALIHPQIAPNTGNIARLCVATGADLHLVRPLGFVLSDRNLRRSAMDYWPRLRLTLHDDLPAFLDFATTHARRLWLLENARGPTLWHVRISPGDILCFGSESAGLPTTLLNAHPDRITHLPQIPGERCLNLSSAASAALYEGLRQLSSPTPDPTPPPP